MLGCNAVFLIAMDRCGQACPTHVQHGEDCWGALRRVWLRHSRIGKRTGFAVRISWGTYAHGVRTMYEGRMKRQGHGCIMECNGDMLRAYTQKRRRRSADMFMLGLDRASGAWERCSGILRGWVLLRESGETQQSIDE